MRWWFCSFFPGTPKVFFEGSGFQRFREPEVPQVSFYCNWIKTGRFSVFLKLKSEFCHCTWFLFGSFSVFFSEIVVVFLKLFGKIRWWYFCDLTLFSIVWGPGYNLFDWKGHGLKSPSPKMSLKCRIARCLGDSFELVWSFGGIRITHITRPDMAIDITLKQTSEMIQVLEEKHHLTKPLFLRLMFRYVPHPVLPTNNVQSHEQTA